MFSFQTGLSALNVNQRLIELAGQNIANANTPGYHRQVASLAAVYNGGEVGSGVEIQRLGRPVNGFLEQAILRNTSGLQNTSAQLEALQGVEADLAAGGATISRWLDDLFNGLEALAASPEDLTQRRTVLQAAGTVADGLRSLAGAASRASADADARGAAAVGRVNEITKEIAGLNGEIQRAEALGQSPNALLDRRDSLLSELAGLVDVRTTEQPEGTTVIAAGAAVVVGGQAVPLAYRVGTDGRAGVVVRGHEAAGYLRVQGGKLAGYLQTRNEFLPGYRQSLDDLAGQLIGRFNSLHATGLPGGGPAATVSGSRSVADPAAPLADLGGPFPVRAGSLYVSVTELATGRRTLTEVAVDPAAQSLAAALGGVAHLQAAADPGTNVLKVLAEPGYAVDFAGRLPTEPDLAAFAGTAVPEVSGAYTGAANDTYTFTASGPGEVGVTAGLSLEVRDGAGDVLAQVGVGAGYEPGSTLGLPNGLRLRLSAGGVAAGDTFTVPVVAAPDTSGVLTALGLGGFFQGATAADIKVRDDLAADPWRLSGSRTGLPGDGGNFARLVGVRDEASLAGGTRTAREYAEDIVAGVGGRVRRLGQQQDAQQALGDDLELQRQAVSGVNTDEELLQLLQFQRAYQYSARYLSVADDMLNELVNIIR